MKATTAGRMEEGRRLFNAGRFFEAHEAWEEAWLVEEGETRKRLQGLIQIAAGFYKAQLGQPAPAARLIEAGLAKLGACVEPFPALEAFAAALSESLAGARRWERGEATGLPPAPVLPELEGVQSE